VTSFRLTGALAALSTLSVVMAAGLE